MLTNEKIELITSLLKIGIDSLMSELDWLKDYPRDSPAEQLPEVKVEQIRIMPPVEELQEEESDVKLTTWEVWFKVKPQVAITKKELEAMKKKEWYQNNKDRQKEYNRRYYEKRKAEKEDIAKLKEFRKKYWLN